MINFSILGIHKLLNLRVLLLSTFFSKFFLKIF